MSRKRAYINWTEYNRLKNIGWLDKDIAKVMGVSPATLSIKVKEKKNGRLKKKDTK